MVVSTIIGRRPRSSEIREEDTSLGAGEKTHPLKYSRGIEIRRGIIGSMKLPTASSTESTR
jgi:hypothetical protein